MLTKKKPSIGHLKPFYSPVLVHIPEDSRPSGSKLAPRAIEGHLVGYQSPSMVRIYIPSKRKVDIFRLRQVRFVPVQHKVGSFELDVPATSSGSTPTQVVTPSTSPTTTDSSDRPSTPPPQSSMPGVFPDTPAHPDAPPPPPTPPVQPQAPPPRPPAPAPTTTTSSDTRAPSPPPITDDLLPFEYDENGNLQFQEWGNTYHEALVNRRRAREEIAEANSQLRQEVASSSSRPQPRRSQRENKGKPPKAWWTPSGSAHIAVTGDAYVAFTGVPSTYKQAMDSLDSSKWIEAMQDEHQRMLDLKVWEELDRSEMPKDRTCVNAGWVYTIKNHADGSLERFKARLVAKGYSQQAGIDYTETFAPVTRYDFLRFLIALATNLNFDFEQLDIKTAFLYGDLDKEISMNPPPGIGLDGKVLRLRKALYGLKQAPLK